MKRKNKVQGSKPYIYVETDGGISDIQDLDKEEWSILENLFQRHPELVAVNCPERDIDLLHDNSFRRR